MPVLYRVSLLTVCIFLLAGTVFGLTGVRSHDWNTSTLQTVQVEEMTTMGSTSGAGMINESSIYDRGIGITDEYSFGNQSAPEDGIAVVAVPEPTSIVLFGLGALAYGAIRSRRRTI